MSASTDQIRAILSRAGFAEAKLDGIRVVSEGFVIIEWGESRNEHVSILHKPGHHATLEGYKAALKEEFYIEPDTVTLHQNCTVPGKHVCVAFI